MNEYIVTFRGAYGNTFHAFIYGNDEFDARLNAEKQHISRYSITNVRYHGPRLDYGHI